MAEFNVNKLVETVAQRAMEKLIESGAFIGWWIPISEELPEDRQNVLFCDIDGDIFIGYHIKDRPDTHFSQDGTYEVIKNVKAWMPLPERYEPQESEEGE